MTLHLEKKAIRALGIAESFRAQEKLSSLAGVVMRSDLVIDGFGFGKLTISGSDAARSLVSLFKRLRRNDINAILLSGSVLSLYNIVDVDYVFSKLELPIVALTFSKSRSDLARNIEERFPEKIAASKVRLLKKLGVPQRLELKTGYEVYVRNSGISHNDSKRLLDRFTLQGSVPEPVRVARLLAKSASAMNPV
ncbi:MAG: endonuclease dU [Nitrososphaerales archaeon]